MNATKTITTFAIAAIALSATVFNAGIADAQSNVKAPVKVAQADKAPEAAPAKTKTETKKVKTSSKKAGKNAKKTETKQETKSAETK